MITFLLENGADINRANHRGETALMMVCRNAVGKKKAIKLLLAAGADVNAADKEGQTALMGLASENGYTELMHILIKFGADPDIRNNKGRTALDLLSVRYPKKYAKWIEETVVKPRRKQLKKEDCKKTALTGFEFDI
jgi:ankyrin repeat protein